MSQESVEVVRRFFENFSAGSGEILASGADFWDADVDYYPVRKFPEARPRHGRAEVVQFLVRFLDAWSDLVWAVEDLIDVGDDRVLARTSMQAEGRESGMKLEGDLYTCFWLRHGRFFRVEDHLTLGGALCALGFEGETLEAVGLS
jgi:ketosteroid isomerase-like protein